MFLVPLRGIEPPSERSQRPILSVELQRYVLVPWCRIELHYLPYQDSVIPIYDKGKMLVPPVGLEPTIRRSKRQSQGLAALPLAERMLVVFSDDEGGLSRSIKVEARALIYVEVTSGVGVDLQ